MPESFWMNQRNIFTLLTELVKQVDNSISILVLFSMANNFYYILIQLLYTTQ